MSPTARVAQALASVRAADPVIDRLAARYAPPGLRPEPTARRFAALAESILFQQLAGAAAATIHGRFVTALGGGVTPERVLATDTATLRAAGLSGAKEASIRDLATKVAAGEVALERIGRRSDEDVVAELTVVRGIGTWTAEMFLLFTLGRLDVWPVGDYGVRAGYAAGWGLEETPTPKALMPLGDRYRPYRSLAAWYCWRALEDRRGGSDGGA